MAKKIASYHPMAVRNAKKAVLRGLDLSLAEGLELEKMLAASLASESKQRLDLGESTK
jgi:enoyl-CoA hydratase/carnithine racemase